MFLKKILTEIELLEEMERILAKEGFRLKHLTEEVKLSYLYSPNKDNSLFEELRARTVKHTIEQSKISHKLQSLRLLAALVKEADSVRFERVIIGAGVAGTVLYQEIPPELRAEKKYHSVLPSIIVLNDPNDPNTWPKEGSRLMGQPAKVQTPSGFSIHSGDLTLSEEGSDLTNPYDYVVATDFYNALLASQTDLNMPILNLKALWIETRETLTQDIKTNWHYIESKHRVAIQVGNEIQYIYTSAIDLCAGLGSSTKLESTQIDPMLSFKLIKENKLVYAQDGEVELKKTVLLYGGSAINSAWATEILSGHVKTDAKILGLVSRNAKSLEAISTLSRFISNACATTLNLHVGVLSNVEELEDGKLKVTFKAPESAGRFKGLKDHDFICCEQLIVAIGQTDPKITQNFCDFEECIYESDFSDIPQIPLGTHSKDGSIITWGALGTLGIGLGKDERRIFNKKVEAHANTYPYESQALGGIFRVSWVIPQMVKQLQAKGLFPRSAQYDSRAYLLPDINQATVDDLIPLISSPIQKLDEIERRKYAQDIISLRSTVMDNSNYDLPGIQHVEQLEAVVPRPFLENIRMKYFPFSSTQTSWRASSARSTFFASKNIDDKDSFSETITALNTEEDTNIYLPPLLQVKKGIAPIEPKEDSKFKIPESFF